LIDERLRLVGHRIVLRVALLIHLHGGVVVLRRGEQRCEEKSEKECESQRNEGRFYGSMRKRRKSRNP
jgi:hypothetical protein